jgi:glutamate synthase domain-containing protein 1
LNWSNNQYDDDKVIDSCGLFGMMDVTGKRFSGKDPIKAMVNMHERGNGLGAGFAVYGLYPEYQDHYAFHIMYMDNTAKEKTEGLLKNNFRIVLDEKIPTKEAKVWNPPILWRYFIEPKSSKFDQTLFDDFIVDKVMRINTETGKAFVFSSGKNMGVFKGVGYPEDIAEFFDLEGYKGYMWTCHSRFPTNTPGWWGGAHPFNILDWTVVHNGELSSYGINRRYLEMFGYKCTMQTDTEVMAYSFDLLMRRQKLPVDVISNILAPPLWIEIDRMPEKKRKIYTMLRQCYGSLLMNGPFAVIVAHHGEMIGLSDRIKLRPFSAGIKGNLLFLSSEEAAIRSISPNLDKTWNPRGGEPVVGRLKKPMIEEIAIKQVMKV